MGLIPVKKLVDEFRIMWKQHWDYVWGSAKKGCVDCSGAFVYAYGLFNKKIAHGSNAIARNYTRNLMTYAEAKKKGIVPGMVALKARKPSDAKYALPDKYRKGGASYNGDLNDYYHIGLVDFDTAYVLNAQSTQTGFQRSPITQNWSHLGYLKDVDYSNNTSEKDTQGGDARLVKMIVSDKNIAKGSTSVNMRAKPSLSAGMIGVVKVGTFVERDSESGEWSHITANGKSGWMMSKFLEPYEEKKEEIKTLEERVADLERRVKLLEEGVG